MEKLSLQEENKIEDIRNLIRLKKELNYTAIKDRILRDIKNIFKHEEEENYYKPVIVNNFRSNSYTEYKSKGDRKIL